MTGPLQEWLRRTQHRLISVFSHALEIVVTRASATKSAAALVVRLIELPLAILGIPLLTVPLLLLRSPLLELLTLSLSLPRGLRSIASLEIDVVPQSPYFAQELLELTLECGQASLNLAILPPLLALKTRLPHLRELVVLELPWLTPLPIQRPTPRLQAGVEHTLLAVPKGNDFDALSRIVLHDKRLKLAHRPHIATVDGDNTVARLQTGFFRGAGLVHVHDLYALAARFTKHNAQPPRSSTAAALLELLFLLEPLLLLRTTILTFLLAKVPLVKGLVPLVAALLIPLLVILTAALIVLRCPLVRLPKRFRLLHLRRPIGARLSPVLCRYRLDESANGQHEARGGACHQATPPRASKQMFLKFHNPTSIF